MRDSTTTGRNTLLIDIGAGVILDAPPETTVSKRWVDTHPFIEHVPAAILKRGEPLGFIVAGPDAKKVAAGSGGLDYVLYQIVGPAPAGTEGYQLKREA